MTPRVSLLMPNRDNAPVLELVLERLTANSRYDDLELWWWTMGPPTAAARSCGGGATAGASPASSG